MMDDLRSLYEEVILDHNRSPRNFQKIPVGANRKAFGSNPLCGDEFTIHLTVVDNTIQDIGFEGVGCAISTASASLMTEAMMGKTEDEAKEIFINIHNMLTQGVDEQDVDPNVLGKLQVLSGVRAYPMRVKCATLSWHVVHAAIKNDSEIICTE